MQEVEWQASLCRVMKVKCTCWVFNITLHFFREPDDREVFMVCCKVCTSGASTAAHSLRFRLRLRHSGYSLILSADHELHDLWHRHGSHVDGSHLRLRSLTETKASIEASWPRMYLPSLFHPHLNLCPRRCDSRFCHVTMFTSGHPRSGYPLARHHSQSHPSC